MKAKNLLVYAVLTAILAGLVTLVTWQMNGWPSAAGQPVTYITFVAWAAYFLFGADIKGAVKALSSMVAGVVAAILMFVLSIAFGFDGFGPWWVVPLAVAIPVVPMCFGEKVKIINNVAAIFMGTGLYFSLSAAGAFGDEYTLKTYAIVGLTTLLYIAIGFAAGWITIQFNIFASKLWPEKKK